MRRRAYMDERDLIIRIVHVPGGQKDRAVPAERRAFCAGIEQGNVMASDRAARQEKTRAKHLPRGVHRLPPGFYLLSVLSGVPVVSLFSCLAARPGGILAPCQPVFLPLLQPGGGWVSLSLLFS